MHPGATLTLAFALAVALVLISTPQAARVALRTGFLDHPLGYKQHGRATPYLGGSAVMLAFLVPALLWGGLSDTFLALGLGAVALWMLGTLDDRINLSPWLRMGVEALAGAGLWLADLGWNVFSADLLNLVLTVVWVIGIVNAFNLMDNLDGATGTVAVAVAVGIATFALIDHDAQLAAIAGALAGACLGFLRYNLARPARIFLGDGGSMPIGFIAAGAALAAADSAQVGAAALPLGAMIVGLVILDTTLVTISRRRRCVPLLTGGRDHLTHRLLTMTGSPQAVAAMLATLQLALCGVAAMAAQHGRHAVLWSAAATLLIGIAVIAVLEVRFGTPVRAAAPAGSRE
ncbi:MAG: MraY family glycosyltransferase [Solirubrobacteraceae bacterium]|nr:MraY family glycosyltransferase [Solirubrobacteraceae bacterium]